MKIITTERVPILSWCEAPEESAIEQAKNLARLPFAFHHVALMPDTHFGFGMPIGGVLATRDVVIPNAVGVDIACGMSALKTSLTEISTEQLKTIMGKIREAVPVGFNKHKEKQDRNRMPTVDIADALPGQPWNPIVNREFDNALLSLGSLGSGNHFLEIQKGSDGHIWIMIHSGSRNLGKQVADHYNGIAKELNAKYFSKVPKEHDLAFLPLDSIEGQSYLKEMNYCVQFAFANRKLMMDRTAEIFCTVTGSSIEPMINIAHNYARMEHHFGKDVLVHRKGATSARKDEIGIIPGSQGTASYIVKGLGNPDSFESCSHGAGRKMGRKEAIRSLNLEDEKAKLDAKGIIHSVRNAQDLDEAPGSYKSIDVVMAEQADLVEILVKLEPLAVIKG